MFKIGQRVKVSFDTIAFPCVTMFAQHNVEATIVGVHCDNADAVLWQSEIYMIEFKTDSFECGYRFPVRASQIEEI